MEAGKSPDSGLVSGFRFFDQTGKSILSCGRISDSGEKYILNEIQITETQRIVGIKGQEREKGQFQQLSFVLAEIDLYED